MSYLSTDYPALTKDNGRFRPVMTQDLFDSITNEYSVASSSKSTNISLPPEIVDIEPVDDKPKSPEIIESMKDEPEISPDLPGNDKSKLSNKEASTQSKTYPPGYIPRAEREKRLRQWAVDHGEDPDKFVTITEKDRDLAYIYHDRLC